MPKVIYNKINGSNSDVINAIHSALPDSVRQSKNFAPLMQGKNERETCKNIFDYVLNQIRYIPDQSTQVIKTPSALLREKTGDCKSYALFIASCLDNLKIPYKFTYASYTNSKTPSHVYITTDSGIIIDPVYRHFNQEKKPTFKFFKK